MSFYNLFYKRSTYFNLQLDTHAYWSNVAETVLYLYTFNADRLARRLSHRDLTSLISPRRRTVYVDLSVWPEKQSVMNTMKVLLQSKESFEVDLAVYIKSIFID